MKKFLALLLCVISTLMLCLGLASCGGGWKYILSSDGTYYSVKWEGKAISVIDGDKNEKFVIPVLHNDLPVKALDICAFGNMPSLEKVILPAHIEIIRSRAFENCTNLKEVVLGDTVKEIHSKAFDGCTGLEEINTPESIITIGENAFSGCAKLLKTVEGITYVDKWMISCSEDLTALNLREGTLGVASAAGKGTYESAVFPESLVAISDHAFYGTSLSNVSLGKNVKYIGEYAFSTTETNNIFYDGTMEDWGKIVVKLNYAKVECTDGSLTHRA